MKSAREVMIENFRNVEAFGCAIAEKIKKDYSHVSYETPVAFAAAYVILFVQYNFEPDDKNITIDYDTFFELADITDKSRKKFFRDNLGDDLNKLSDMFFVFQDQAVKDFIAARGTRNLEMRSLRSVFTD